MPNVPFWRSGEQCWYVKYAGRVLSLRVRDQHDRAAADAAFERLKAGYTDTRTPRPGTLADAEALFERLRVGPTPPPAIALALARELLAVPGLPNAELQLAAIRMLVRDLEAVRHTDPPL